MKMAAILLATGAPGIEQSWLGHSTPPGANDSLAHGASLLLLRLHLGGVAFSLSFGSRRFGSQP